MAACSSNLPDPLGPGGESAERDGSSRIRRTRLGQIPIDPGSAHALVSSRRAIPGWAPRIHLGRRAADGSIAALDRATGERFVVYTPRFSAQFAAGARPFSWYVRALAAAGEASLAFPTARAALEALERGTWRARPVAPPRKPTRPLRVVWSRS